MPEAPILDLIATCTRCQSQDEAPFSILAVKGWRLVQGRWVCPRCARSEPRRQPRRMHPRLRRRFRVRHYDAAIADRVLWTLREAGITQEQAGQVIGQTQPGVNALRSGRRITAGEIVALAEWMTAQFELEDAWELTLWLLCLSDYNPLGRSA